MPKENLHEESAYWRAVSEGDADGLVGSDIFPDQLSSDGLWVENEVEPTDEPDFITHINSEGGN